MWICLLEFQRTKLEVSRNTVNFLRSGNQQK